MGKERESNFELLRILSMLMVVLTHANYWSLGSIGIDEIYTEPVHSFLRVFSEQLCIVGVNVFVLISGWFGIKPSLKGFISLMFQIFFWGLASIAFCLLIGQPPYFYDTLKVFYLGGWYWFIPAYLGLFLIAPALNTFVETSSPKTLLYTILASFALEIIYGWITKFGPYYDGYTIIAFILLYLSSRGLCKYKEHLKLSTYSWFSIYLITSLAGATFALLEIRYKVTAMPQVSYISPFVIASSVALLLAFSMIKLKSHVINWLACSVFSVYLFHTHPSIGPEFKRIAYSLYLYVDGGFCYTAIAIFAAIGLTISCILVDKIRLVLWKYLWQLTEKIQTQKK